MKRTLISLKDKFEECYADLMKVGRDLDDETLALQLMEGEG